MPVVSGVPGRVGAAVLLVPGGFAVGHEVAYRLGHTGGHEGPPATATSTLLPRH